MGRCRCRKEEEEEEGEERKEKKCHGRVLQQVQRVSECVGGIK